MIDYLKTNISWIKDAIGALVSLLTVTIAFFTYRKAKSTLFQPLRSEVIKHQMSLFEKIVEVLDPVTFMGYIDYQTIAAANLYLHLRKYGCTLGDDIDKEVDDSVGGEIIINTNNITLFPPLMTDAKTIEAMEERRYPLPKDHTEVLNNRKKALEGIIEINEVVLTKDHLNAMNELTSIRDNPWLPKAIYQEMTALIDDINYNLRNMLPQALCLAIKEFCETTKVPLDTSQALLPGKVLNYILVNGRDHKIKLNRLQKKMKKHLRVDYRW